MGNASFHTPQKKRGLIQSIDCKIIFLPPYSLNLNSIDQFWATMKRWIKDRIRKFVQ
ncbi:transposase [Holospora curviuscula]|uniref:transposase n=1 Tax=Holospora curviuscula TaxID=1082868 RepID=UPI0013FD92BF